MNHTGNPSSCPHSDGAGIACERRTSRGAFALAPARAAAGARRFGRGRLSGLEAVFAVPPLPDSIVALSGRIEGDDSAVAPKTSGRILERACARATASRADR